MRIQETALKLHALVTARSDQASTRSWCRGPIGRGGQWLQEVELLLCRAEEQSN